MTQKLTLTPEQRSEFLTQGIVRVPGIVPLGTVDAMAESLWMALASKHHVLRNRPETWTKALCAHFGDVARSGAFTGMMSADLGDLLDDFFGARGWDRHLPLPPAPLPVTFAIGGQPWSIPSRSWHLDLGRAADALRETGKAWPDYVRIFSFLAPVARGGGGTAYVAGSHRPAMEIMADMAREGETEFRSAAVIKRMKAESSWIAGLYSPGTEAERTSRFMETGGELRGSRLRVAEVIGQPGDVVLWHPALLHSLAPNSQNTPRLMLSATAYAKS